MQYKFEFSADEVNLIFAALSELPLKSSVGLFTKLKAGVMTQEAEYKRAAAAPPAEEPKAKAKAKAA